MLYGGQGEGEKGEHIWALMHWAQILPKVGEEDDHVYFMPRFIDRAVCPACW